MNDFTNLFQNECPEKLAEMNERELQDVKGNFNRALYEEHSSRYNQDKWSEILGGIGKQDEPKTEQAKDVWQVPFVRDTYDEDNDSSEEESDEDDQMMTMV